MMGKYKSQWIKSRWGNNLIIDNSYSGSNDIWMMPVYATRDTVIEVGDRVCQFRIMEQQPHINFEEVATLEGEDRGGFGSTGKK